MELTPRQPELDLGGAVGRVPGGPQDRLISYLPLAHIAEQHGSICNHALAGYQLYFARSLESLGEHLQEVHPTVFFGVPRVWEEDAGRHCHQAGGRHGRQGPAGAGPCAPGAPGTPSACRRTPGAWLDRQYRWAHQLVHRKGAGRAGL